MNSRYSLLVLTLATLTAPAALMAQAAADDATPQDQAQYQYQTQQPAPVERSAPDNGGGYTTRGRNQQAGGRRQPANNILTTQPAAGIFLRTTGTVETVTAQAGTVELRLTSGIANVNVHHPAKDSLIQVDLPGGQVNLLKDGLYTFNANTNTVRVLKGEAQTTVAGQAKPVKIKEDHDFVFGGDGKAHDFYPVAARADLLPMNGEDRGEPAAYYGYGPYGGYAPYAAYGYGYPYAAYGYGYPYGYGWGPSFGLGFGYYGGFGGYRGGFGGFRGRGFRR